VLIVGLYSQDPILSHLVGKYWYYHTGGGHQVSGHGTGGSGYQADGGHGVQDQDNVQHDHGTVNADRNLETYEVLPASTYKLNMPDVIPDASLKLQFNQADLSPSFDVDAKDSDKIGSVTVIPSLSTLLKDSRFDYLISESSTQALETHEMTQQLISSPFPEIKSHSPPARVRELRPGSGRIIRAKRLATSGAELMDWFGGKVVLLMVIGFIM
jgi:hypothetical protein